MNKTRIYRTQYISLCIIMAAIGLQYGRHMLFSVRRTLGKPREVTSNIHSIVSNDLLRYRGCRAGRHVQERRQRTATDLRGTAANKTSTTLPGGGHWPAPTEGINITTVVGRRLNRGNFHGRGNSRPRVLADMTRHTAVPKRCRKSGAETTTWNCTGRIHTSQHLGTTTPTVRFQCGGHHQTKRCPTIICRHNKHGDRCRDYQWNQTKIETPR